jgi:hypothetical protein
MFRIGSSKVAGKYTRQHAEAPRNRKELFKGSVNYHWRSDEGKVKGSSYTRYESRIINIRLGWMVSQDKDKAGVAGTHIVHVRQAIIQALMHAYISKTNDTSTKWVTDDDVLTQDLWIGTASKLFFRLRNNKLIHC